MIRRKVRSASCALIHGKQLVLDAAKNQRMQPGTRIHLASDDGRQFLTITEVLEADAVGEGADCDTRGRACSPELRRSGVGEDFGGAAPLDRLREA